MPRQGQAGRRKPAGTSVAAARGMLLSLSGMEEGRSYGLPSFKLGGRFFARFRDDDTVLVLQLDTRDDRDYLMQAHPRACFFTAHYRNYPAVLIRLEEIAPARLKAMLSTAWEDLSTRRTRAVRPRRVTAPSTRKRRAQ